MTQDEFIQSFTEVIKDNSDSPITTSFDAETRFKELESWGSLTAVMIIVMVEERYGKQISTDDLENCDTIGSLYKIIETM